MKKIILLASVILCILFAACGEADEHSVTFELEQDPSLDFEWKVVQSEELFDVSTEVVEEEKGGKKIEKKIVTLHPKEAGLITVSLLYSRPEEEYARNEYVYAFIINDDLSITSGEKTGGGPSALIQ